MYILNLYRSKLRLILLFYNFLLFEIILLFITFLFKFIFLIFIYLFFRVLETFLIFINSSTCIIFNFIDYLVLDLVILLGIVVGGLLIFFIISFSFY